MAKKVDFDKVKKDVKKLVSDIVETPAGDIADDARFSEDLGVDSMKALEIVAAVEKRFKVVIPEKKIPAIRSVQNVYDILQKQLK